MHNPYSSPLEAASPASFDFAGARKICIGQGYFYILNDRFWREVEDAWRPNAAIPEPNCTCLKWGGLLPFAFPDWNGTNATKLPFVLEIKRIDARKAATQHFMQG